MNHLVQHTDPLNPDGTLRGREAFMVLMVSVICARSGEFLAYIFWLVSMISIFAPQVHHLQVPHC